MSTAVPQGQTHEYAGGRARMIGGCKPPEHMHRVIPTLQDLNQLASICTDHPKQFEASDLDV